MKKERGEVNFNYKKQSYYKKSKQAVVYVHPFAQLLHKHQSPDQSVIWRQKKTKKKRKSITEEKNLLAINPPLKVGIWTGENRGKYLCLYSKWLYYNVEIVIGTAVIKLLRKLLISE